MFAAWLWVGVGGLRVAGLGMVEVQSIYGRVCVSLYRTGLGIVSSLCEW